MEGVGKADSVKYYQDFDIKDIGAFTYHQDWRRKETTANLIICGDTETSKQPEIMVPTPNYIVAWSVCVLNYEKDIQMTYWGHRPDTMVMFLETLQKAVDAGIYVYFHNLNYDYTFLRLFAFERWGYPESQLAVKPHRPLFVKWSEGQITLKDSLIIAQRTLGKWAKDMNVKHQKAAGFWDYDKIRSQQETFTEDELLYIVNDVRALSECLDALRRSLGIISVCDLPITSTSIVRNEARKRSRGSSRKSRLNWHAKYRKLAPQLQVYQMLERAYHGGYTHANRFCIEDVYNDVQGYDFASSYPYIMMSERFPMEEFSPFECADPRRILALRDDFAFVFELLIYDFDLKEGIEMPYLQRSKITKWSDDYVIDNGRVISGSLAQITYTEIDLELFVRTYNFKMIAVKNCYKAGKGYLPEWLRQYIYELFVEKTKLKGGDPVAYALAKARLNGVYGMCVEKQIRPEFVENYETGEYTMEYPPDPAEALEKKYNAKNSFLPYQWGVFVCAYAVRNLYELGKCCDLWLYSDTDSVKGIGWDKNAVAGYNIRCRQKLIEAGIFEPVYHNGREYWLGVAEDDGLYQEFVTLGAKRYCVREDGELKITVAGVPKKGAACLHNIEEFAEGKVFDGPTTGKKMVTYFLDKPIREENGILFGDSVDLSDCDYLLSKTEKYDGFWEVYSEVLPFDVT